jgi:hypothetical protein
LVGARVINTPALLLSAIRAGILTVEADQAKTVLEQHRFRVKFKVCGAVGRMDGCRDQSGIV